MILLLPALCVLFFEPPAPPRRATVLASLSEPGCAALRVELEAIAPNRFVVVREPAAAAAAARLSKDGASAGGDDVVAFFGYPLPELAPLAIERNCERLASPDSHPLDDESGRYVVLFADPLVAAIDERTVKGELGRDVAEFLPSDADDLCRAAFEDRFFCARPAADNVIGALFGRLAVANERSLDELLAGFGGNVEASAIPNAAAAVARVRSGGAPAFALLSRSEFAALGGEAPDLHGVVLFGSAVAVVRGLALAPGRSELDALLPAMFAADGDALGRIGRAESVVPLRGAASRGLDEAALAVRRAMEFEAPRISREQAEAAGVVARFEAGLKDALKRRRERFEDVYDVVALIGMALFVVVFIMRRKAKDAAAAAP